LAGKAAAQSKLYVLPGDVSNEGTCAECAHFVRDKTGRVDVLVNAAGFFPIRPFEEMTLGDWNEVVGTNLTGVFLMVRAMLPSQVGSWRSAKVVARCRCFYVLTAGLQPIFDSPCISFATVHRETGFATYEEAVARYAAKTCPARRSGIALFRPPGTGAYPGLRCNSNEPALLP
jgi:short-subunit dehydrogenase involved in D-alanine esterification of teichoic acids